MINKKMTFICAQPDVPYFHWQVEVLIHNLMKSGVNPNWIEILFAYDEAPSNEGVSLASRYPYVRFFFYRKTPCDNYGYIPILRPDILEQHFTRFPNLSLEPIFYHDSDIIFRELPDFNKLLEDDNWYFSDTVSYIGANYIKSKSTVLFETMCNIASVSKELVEENEANSGGAQYLMKGIDHLFWRDVKFVSLDLYKYMMERENDERQTLTEEELRIYNPVQKWCADMWAVFWCGLKRGAEVRISEELSFSWGSTYGQEEWNKHKIYHNAGVVNNQDGKVFYKGEYIDKSPFDSDFSRIDPNHNTYNYVQAILYAKEKRAFS
jgi:hypothetical protein